MSTWLRSLQKKSTNVRAELGRRGVGLSFALLSRPVPRLAAWWAERLFFTPPRGYSRRIESFVATGEPFTVRDRGRRIAAWRWGRGPAVVLVHGWGGQGGQLEGFVSPLVDAGFSAVTFDAPGHGRSGAGLSSLVDFAHALRALAAEVGPLHAAVTHSLGGAAVSFAIHRGLVLPRAVFISPSGRPAYWAQVFARQFGVTPGVMDLVRARAEKRLQVRWSELDMPSVVRGFDAELLVIHDDRDLEVPLADGALIAESWPGARLVTTTGLGHRRILRDPEVIRRAVAFATQGRSTPRAEPVSETALLEAELFDPSRRPRPRPFVE